MAEKPETPGDERRFKEMLGRQVARRARAEEQPEPTVWFGLGMFGVVGWSIAIPTLAGIALGIWLDHNAPAGHSWTLTLLVVGAALGCWNAWYWVKQERPDDRTD